MVTARQDDDSQPRRRNAVATREAILTSGRKAFARHGYDGVGVRDIAAEAGVTAMMVNRYFGSKEKLFAEALDQANRDPVILSKENLANPDLAEAFARALVEITRPDATPLDGFSILMRSASSPRAAEIGRAQIEGGHHKTMRDALGGKQADERAAILLALVAGFQMMRQMIGLSSLTEADPEALAALLTPVFRDIIAPGT